MTGDHKAKLILLLLLLLALYSYWCCQCSCKRQLGNAVGVSLWAQAATAEQRMQTGNAPAQACYV